MAVEFDAVCPARPDPAIVGRAVEVVLRVVTGAAAPVAVESDAHGWLLRLGGVGSAEVVETPPGRHEFADRWVVTAAPGTREPVPELLAVVTAAAAAALYGGRFLDETGLLRPPAADGAEVLARVLAHPGAGPEAALAAVRPPPDAPIKEKMA